MLPHSSWLRAPAVTDGSIHHTNRGLMVGRKDNHQSPAQLDQCQTSVMAHHLQCQGALRASLEIGMLLCSHCLCCSRGRAIDHHCQGEGFRLGQLGVKKRVHLPQRNNFIVGFSQQQRSNKLLLNISIKVEPRLINKD